MTEDGYIKALQYIKSIGGKLGLLAELVELSYRVRRNPTPELSDQYYELLNKAIANNCFNAERTAQLKEIRGREMRGE